MWSFGAVVYDSPWSGEVVRIVLFDDVLSASFVDFLLDGEGCFAV